MKKLICLGDSITGSTNLALYPKWSDILQVLCDCAVKDEKIEVLNRGIAGNTTRQVLDRLEDDVITENPDLVVLLIGGNDRGEDSGIDPEETEKNIEEIIDRIQKTGAKILLLNYHLIIHPEYDNQVWKHLVKSNGIIRNIARETGLPLLEMDKPMQDALEYRTHEELVFLTDGVHLHPGGEMVYSREIFNKLSELGWL